MRSRGSPRLSDGLTFGGRIPAAVGLVILLLVAFTLAGWITGASPLAALSPRAILGGQLWRLVSWVFVQPQGDALGLFFGGLILWSMGSQLAFAWGEGRFLARFFGITVGASLGTIAVSALWQAANQGHLGMWPVVNALILSWALLHPEQQVSIWGVLPLTGRTLGILVVAGTALYALATAGVGGFAFFVPHFVALGIAWALSQGRLPTRRWRMQLGDWMREREFKRRSKHLKVVKKNGPGDPPQWMN